MKFSWLLMLLLVMAVAVFSVQNAAVTTVRFLVWQVSLSAALVIQLAAVLGVLAGFVAGFCARRRPPRAPGQPDAEPARPPADDAGAY